MCCILFASVLWRALFQTLIILKQPTFIHSQKVANLSKTILMDCFWEICHLKYIFFIKKGNWPLCPKGREMFTNFPQWRTLSKAGTKRDYYAKLPWTSWRRLGTLGRLGHNKLYVTELSNERENLTKHCFSRSKLPLNSDTVLCYYFSCNRSESIGFLGH